MSLEDKYTVKFKKDGCAILTMKNGQNRLDFDTFKAIHNALDKVERWVNIENVVSKRYF